MTPSRNSRGLKAAALIISKKRASHHDGSAAGSNRRRLQRGKQDEKLLVPIVAPYPTTAPVRRPPGSAACFPAGSAALQPVAATHRRGGGIPHGPGRAR
jgi:hypothetical protein